MGYIAIINDNGPIASFFSRRNLRKILKQDGFKRLFWSRPASEVYRKGETEAQIVDESIKIPKYDRSRPSTIEAELAVGVPSRTIYRFGVEFSGKIEPQLQERVSDWFDAKKSGGYLNRALEPS